MALLAGGNYLSGMAVSSWVQAVAHVIKNFDDLARDELHRLALELLEEGIRAADPKDAICRCVALEDDAVRLCTGQKVTGFKKIHVIGFGKASIKMAEGIYEVLGDRIEGGVVIAPRAEVSRVGPLEVHEADHPLPTKRTLDSSLALVEYIWSKVSPDDLLFVLVSGGGSALFEIPADDITIEDVAKVTEMVMKSGADIYELNAVRKHISLVKGGGLLRLAKAKKVVALIVSDVVGDRLDTIASGPTTADETTYADAVSVLKRRGVWDKIPETVRKWLEKGLRGEAPETVKPGDPVLSKVINVIVASNKISLEAMARKASEKGFRSLILTPYLQGEAREVGKVLAAIAWSIRRIGYPVEPPAVILAGGETTVTVRGGGVGGRNQELCLALALEIKGMERAVFACMGSDGVDGVSPAAGAIVDGGTCAEAVEKGYDPQVYLANNDSYTFFSKLGRAIMTGYTGTNVNDFFVGVIAK